MAHAEDGSSLPRLVEIMRTLLGPGGCPWDREQTLSSLRSYVIEEAHEVVEAIDGGEPGALQEELGDLLLQVVFQSELARAQGWFGPDDVVAGICDKLQRRHPHVFGDVEVRDADEVSANWDAIKALEKAERGTFDGVPVALPALLRAMRIGQRASRIGFDWPDAVGPRAKVDEELAEFDAACASGSDEEAERELGDVLFALCSVARKRGLDPEGALRGTLGRFVDRVAVVERASDEAGESVAELAKRDPAALDALWSQAKRGQR